MMLLLGKMRTRTRGRSTRARPHKTFLFLLLLCLAIAIALVAGEETEKAGAATASRDRRRKEKKITTTTTTGKESRPAAKMNQMGEGNHRGVATTGGGVTIKRKETNDENEYEQLKTRFIDAKNVPIWEEPTESSLVQSSVSSTSSRGQRSEASERREAQKFNFIGFVIIKSF